MKNIQKNIDDQIITKHDVASTEVHGTVQTINIADICMDSMLQVREKTDPKRIKKYAELMQDGIPRVQGHKGWNRIGYLLPAF